MKARFIGDPRHNGDGPAVLHLYGVDFAKGEWVDPIPSTLEAKLPGNNHFETAESGAATVHVKIGPTDVYVFGDATTEIRDIPAAEASREAAETANASPFAAFDHDRDGKPGGSTSSPEKDALFAELEALKAPFDRRWGVPRLKAALEVAQFQQGDND